MEKNNKEIKGVGTSHKLNSRDELSTEFIYGFEAGEQSALSNQWVSIDERMPEVGQRILVCYRFQSPRNGTWQTGYVTGKYNGSDMPDGAICWMPIPPLPEYISEKYFLYGRK